MQRLIAILFMLLGFCVIDGAAVVSPAHADSRTPCRYVAAMANANREEELYVDLLGDNGPVPLDLRGDGVTYYVSIGVQGTARAPNLSVSKTPIAGPEWPEMEPGNPFWSVKQLADNGATGFEPGDELHLFALDGKYYLLNSVYANGASDGRRAFPYGVFTTDDAAACFIDYKLQPILTTDADRPLCDRFLSGDPLEPVPLASPAGPVELLQSVGGRSERFRATYPGAGWFEYLGQTAIDLQNDGHPVSVAAVNQSSGAGAGCETTSLVMFDEQTLTVLPGTLNDQLLALPRDCWRGRAYLVRSGGKNYVEVDRGAAPAEGGSQRVGLYAVRQDELNPVCVIDNRAQFSAD